MIAASSKGSPIRTAEGILWGSYCVERPLLLCTADPLSRWTPSPPRVHWTQCWSEVSCKLIFSSFSSVLCLFCISPAFVFKCHRLSSSLSIFIFALCFSPHLYRYIKLNFLHHGYSQPFILSLTFSIICHSLSHCPVYSSSSFTLLIFSVTYIDF